MILNAPAKVNLYLRVLGKMPDGYHAIETIFEKIQLYDKIVLRSLKENKIKIFCDNPEIPTDKKSLIYRTISLLKRLKRPSGGIEAKIFKKIPIAAGLGGGSSDSASVLMGLNKLWKLALNPAELVSFGKKLGSDIPFFLNKASFAIGRQRGDEITPLPRERIKFWHLVIYPPVKVLSKDVYGMYSKKPLRRTQFLRNDLEPFVIKKAPVAGRIKAALSRIGIKHSLVSGSGPSVFAIFKTRKEAAWAKRTLIRQFSSGESAGWRIFIAPTL